MITRYNLARPAWTFLLVCVVFGFVSSALGADSAAQTRAARLTIVQGSVTVTEPNNAAIVPGQVNLALLSGAQVATGGDGEAEIEFEDGSVVRLTPNTALSLDHLVIGSDGIFVTDMSLLRGLAYSELRATPQYSFMLNAVGDILSPVENTTVRVNFDQPPASFAVLDGTAQIERQGGANGGYQAQVRAGESLRADTTDSSRYFLTQDIAADSWDQWNDDLDQAAVAASSSSTAVRDGYAGADGYGWSDLDANGSWYNVPGEGQVWQPNVAETDAGFDPYGNGAWVWSGGAGYVWASGYAWGWTPYRCGNWSYYNGFGWGWAPGAGCGGRGWGFWGGGNPVNIKRFPPGYHPIRVPTPRPGPVRPILPVRPMSVAQQQSGAVQLQRGPKMANGQMVSRIAPVRSPLNATGEANGSSLRRDFPVNPANHNHELGLASTPQAVAHGTLQGTPTGQAPQPAYVNREQQYPAASGYRQAPGNQPVLRAPNMKRPSQPEAQQRDAPSGLPQNQPGQRNEPAPARQVPQQRYEPRPVEQHPSYTPPPSHPSYAPPPQQSQPHFSPPPPPSHPSAAPQGAAPAQPHSSGK